MKKSILWSVMATMGILATNSMAETTSADYNTYPLETQSMAAPLSKVSKLNNVMVAVDMMEAELILVNVHNDIMLQQCLDCLAGWPGGRPQHVVVSSDAKTIYVTTDASADSAARVVILKVEEYNWNEGFAELKVVKSLLAEDAGTLSTFNTPTQTSDEQPIASWTQPGMTQLHGPTLLPYSKYAYFTQWTDNKIRVINTKTQEFAAVDPIVIEGVTDNTHGVFFNKSGTLGISTGYYYDNNDIDLFKVNKKTGGLKLKKKIRLGDNNAYAAFTHFNTWLDERYAVTASMQFGATSLTPEGVSIIPPSVWMIDTWEDEAWKILDSTNDEFGSGVLRSASDLTVAAGKLYIAEEDSIDGIYGEDGFISIYDLSDRNKPIFIKRLKPGVELPADFAVAHGLGVTANQRFIYITSYASRYILKLDTKTDTIVKVYGAEDGLTMPHGGYVSGAIR